MSYFPSAKVHKAATVSIPVSIASLYGIEAGDCLEFQLTAKGILVTKADEKPIKATVTPKGRDTIRAIFSGADY